MVNDNRATSMKVAQLNCNGLSSHCVTVVDKFLYDNKIEVLALQETGDHSSNEQRFSNKTVFFHFSTHGVGLVINSCLQPQWVPSLSSRNVDVVWAICRVDNDNILIGSAYCPPSGQLSALTSSIKDSWEYCKKNHIKSMLCLGDYNARNIVWGDHATNGNGTALQNFVDTENNFCILSPMTPTFTCLNPRGTSVIDLIISAGKVTSKLSGSVVDVHTELYSGAPGRGHFPVITKLYYPQSKIFQRERLDFLSCDWRKWSEFLDDKISEQTREVSMESVAPEDLLSLLLNCVSEANKTHIPIKRISSHSKPYWCPILSELSLKVRNARIAYNSRSTPRNKGILDEIKERFTFTLLSKKNEWIHEKLEGLNVVQSQEFWAKYKFVFGSQKDNYIGNLIKEGVLVTEEEDKEDLIYDTFFSGRHLENRGFDDTHLRVIRRELDQILLEPADDEGDYLNAVITRSEVDTSILRQKSGAKALDTYGIHPIMLKNLGPIAKEFLVKLFNKVLEKGTWQWTESMTCMIRKEGKDDYMSPGAYRPICLSSYIGKILERIIEHRMMQFCLINNIIDEEQEGFLPNKNTGRYLYRMVSALKESQRKNLTSLVLLIDFEKAYDSVPIECLLVKVYRLGIRGRLFRLLHSFLSTRTTRIKVNDTIGPMRVLSLIGLPQGAVLAPLLFILYVSDLLTHRSLPSLNREWIQSFKFADDGSVVVIADDEVTCIDIMQDLCDYISDWSTKWRLVVNCSRNKTEAMFVYPRKRKKDDNASNHTRLPELQICGKTVNYVKRSKVLGVEMDSELNFNGHARKKLKQGWFIWHEITKKTTRVRGLNSSSMLILLKTVIFPKLMYASPIWMKNNLGVFKEFLAKVKLKLIGAEFYPSHDVMDVILGLPPLEILCDITALKFVLKCLSSNDIMTGLVYQIAETPAHPFYDHIQVVKNYLKSIHQTDVECSRLRSVRNIDIGLLPVERFHYTKNSIETFLCSTWDRRLKSDSSLFFQSTVIHIDTSAIRENPLIRRHERRKNNVQYLDFIHGKSARFKDFRNRVGIASNGICENCNIERDSVDHKLFRCTSFRSENRNNFINLIGDHDYRSAVLFSKDERIRSYFRKLVDTICVNSNYNYRDVLNRN